MCLTVDVLDRKLTIERKKANLCRVWGKCMRKETWLRTQH